MQFHIIGSIVITLLSVIIFAFLSYVYWQNIKPLKSYQKYVLMSLRILSLVFIIFLILDPWFQWSKQIETRANLSIYLDASISMQSQFDFDKIEIGELKYQIDEWSDKNNLDNEWYLFGEKALLERVESLKSRTSDDPFIPELVSLNNQINEIQNNNLLQTLEERQDDSPFIARINELDIESAKLKSIILDITGIDAMQVQQYASAMPIPSNSSNRLLIVLALFGGFVMSIILALLMNLFKEEETDK